MAAKTPPKLMNLGLGNKVLGQGLDRHTIQSPHAVPRCVVVPTTGEPTPFQRRPSQKKEMRT